jgi:hypothetical protein
VVFARGVAQGLFGGGKGLCHTEILEVLGGMQKQGYPMAGRLRMQVYADADEPVQRPKTPDSGVAARGGATRAVAGFFGSGQAGC